MKDDLFTLIVEIATIILLTLFSPFISFFFCWIGGWIAKITIGGILCKALNMLLNVAYFTPDKIPMMAGALGWIAGFFKNSVSLKKKD